MVCRAAIWLSAGCHREGKRVGESEKRGREKKRPVLHLVCVQVGRKRAQITMTDKRERLNDGKTTTGTVLCITL